MFTVILAAGLIFADCKNGVCTADRAAISIFKSREKKSERKKRFKGWRSK